MQQTTLSASRQRLGNSGCKYPVKKIITHTLTTKGVTKFRVHWAPPDEGVTMEPIECLRDTPLLIKKYVLREAVKFRQRLRQQSLDENSVPFQFPKMKPYLANKLRHPAESYIPVGTEKIYRILEEIEVARGVKLWNVKFYGMDESHFINKERIVYYFPLNACLFVNECFKFDMRNNIQF
jgi:hypothetical protein